MALLLPVGSGSVSAMDSKEYQANWPQWRGPTANGVALQGNPPLEWSESKNIKWKTPIPGEGHSTPVIWGNKIFVLAAVPTGKTSEVSAAAGSDAATSGGRRGGGAPSEVFAFTTFCIDRQTGKILWQQVGRSEAPHEGRHQTNTYASASPVTDGSLVISFFNSYGLHCYDMDGNLVWRRDLGKMKTRNAFGEGSSPLLHEDTLIVLWDNEEDSFVHAFDKKTGRELWKKSRDERTGWTTPRLVKVGGKAQVVINGTTAVRSYDLKTGDLIWQCAGQTANAIPSIVADPETVYVMSGFRGSAALAIRLGSSGDLSGSDAVRWKLGRGTPYVPSPLLYDGLLFFCQGNNGILSCVDASTGVPHYTQERLESIRGVYASPVGAAGRVYLAGREGTTLVLEKSKELKILATNPLDDPIDASPAVVGDELFLRGHHHLYCISRDVSSDG